MKKRSDGKYVLNEEELRGLLLDSLTLKALKYGGVGKWEWYGEALEMYCEDEFGDPDYELEDAVEAKITKVENEEE